MKYIFDNKEFSNFLKRKKRKILEKTTDNIQESNGFKTLYAGLKSMISNNAYKGQRIISIAEDDIVNIKFENIPDFNDLFASDEFTYYQKLTLDSSLNFIDYERTRIPDDSGEVRRNLAELSTKGNVIFVLLHDKINYFIKGIDKTESIFFTLSDMNRFNEKKNISQIEEVISIYQKELYERRNYSKFFIELSHLKSLRIDLSSIDNERDFIIKYKHLLRNKPEDSFRDDLRDFLKFHLKVHQVKEYLLENLKRLDIYLYDEFGEIYLIEVKWVGLSVHQEGKKLGTSYKDSDINPKAFIQALDYLEELDSNGQNIVRAYLAVFDGRKENLVDTGNNFDKSILNAVQLKNYNKLCKLKDIRVINKHPN